MNRFLSLPLFSSSSSSKPSPPLPILLLLHILFCLWNIWCFEGVNVQQHMRRRTIKWQTYSSHFGFGFFFWFHSVVPLPLLLLLLLLFFKRRQAINETLWLYLLHTAYISSPKWATRWTPIEPKTTPRTVRFICAVRCRRRFFYIHWRLYCSIFRA